MIEEVDDATEDAMTTAFLRGAESTGLPLTDTQEIPNEPHNDLEDALEGWDARRCIVV
jgi:hypothetical protein